MDFEELRSDLERFKKLSGNELDFRPIRKWMRKLGVQELDNPRGSHVLFYHQVFEQINGTGHFGAKLEKKGRAIYRKNFLEYLYKRLKTIIDLLEVEENEKRR